MDLEQRLSVKLLAQATATLGKAVNETLCTEPDRRVVRALVRESLSLIQEFEEQYFELESAGRDKPAQGQPPQG